MHCSSLLFDTCETQHLLLDIAVYCAMLPYWLLFLDIKWWLFTSCFLRLVCTLGMLSGIENYAHFSSAILNGASSKMTHGCCVPLWRKKKKGYRTVIIDGKTVKVLFHKLPDIRKSWAIRLKRLYVMWWDVGMSWPCIFPCRTTSYVVCKALCFVLVYWYK